jgi:hypothetical protein
MRHEDLLGAFTLVAVLAFSLGVFVEDSFNLLHFIRPTQQVQQR